MRFEKKLNEWYRRGLELEMQGFDPGIIGTTSRIRRLRARLRNARLYGDAVVRTGKGRLTMAIIGTPELKKGHIKLDLTLDLPLSRDGRRLADKAGPAFQALVNDAVSELRKSERRGAHRRTRRTGSA